MVVAYNIANSYKVAAVVDSCMVAELVIVELDSHKVAVVVVELDSHKVAAVVVVELDS